MTGEVAALEIIDQSTVVEREGVQTAAAEEEGADQRAGDRVAWYRDSVQCDRCKRWRQLPRHISLQDLPDQWYVLEACIRPYTCTFFLRLI